jgi:hypothetical protein
MAIFGYDLGEILTSQFIYFVIIFLLGVILLHIATKILNFEKRGFGKAVGVLLAGNVVAFLLAFIPYVGRILGLIGFWFFIKSFYDVSWGKAILAWIMSIVVAFIVAFFVLLVFGLSVLYIPNF